MTPLMIAPIGDYNKSVAFRSFNFPASVCEDGNRQNDEWLLMFVAGMWFQDLWTYDFRRTEMCIIP